MMRSLFFIQNMTYEKTLKERDKMVSITKSGSRDVWDIIGINRWALHFSLDAPV